MKKIILYLLILFPFLSFAQFTDDFADGDFIADPTWSGDVGSFEVNPGFMLHSTNVTTSSTFCLTTPSTLTSNAQWEFYVNLQLNTSSTNYVDIFLISSTDVLTASLDGYFVRIGGTSDEICLYRKDGAAAPIKIIDGIDGVTNTSNNILKIKVVRDAANLFTLERDITGAGTAYVTEGTITDATYTSSAFFGILVKQSTASFFQKHFFDDFYVGPIVVDITPPTVVSATVISTTQVDVLFSENVEQSSAETLTNYTGNNGLGNPTVASRDVTNNKLVHLTFPVSFTSATTYTLTVTNVEDLVANAITGNNTADFVYYAPPVFKEIIFNEIFADPSPQIGLPNFEYVELYNKTTAPVNLSSWTLTHNTTVRVLPNVVLPPDSFVVLTAPSGVVDLAPYGNVAGVVSLSTSALTNTGTSLVLKNPSGTVIDSVFYSDSWYRDAVKDDGGYSLELINPNAPISCPDANNWIASNNLNGGTPGSQNSVYDLTLDNISPTVSSVSIINSNQIVVCFSESLDASTISTLTNYSLSNAMGNPSSIVVNTTLSCATLTFGSAMINTTSYVLSYTNLQDCSGNTLATATSNFTFFVPQQFDVIITEIMADPTPLVSLPDAEYIELYNRTAYPINFQNWTITHGTTIRTIPSGNIPANGYLVLVNENSVSTLQSYTANVVGVPSLSSSALTNSGTSLSLKDNNGNLLYSVTYSDTWYGNTTKAEGGWSLEMMDPNNPCGAENNWIASNANAGGTPGTTNSVNATNPDIGGPKLYSVRVVTPSHLKVTFSEKVIGTDLNLTNSYSVAGGIFPTSVTVAPDGLSVDLFYSSPFLPVVWTLTVNGTITDCVGNAIPASSSMKFSLIGHKQFDVLITEIMPDPDPVKGLPNSEYFELYNNADYPINVYNWKIYYGSSSKTLPDYVLQGKSYAAFVPASLKKEWKTYENIAFVDGLSESAFTNTGAALSLTDSVNKNIHFVNYKDTWYNDNTKADGGWALEMIDYNNPCGTTKNWSASTNPNGGTPGKVNSIYASNADNTAPQIYSVCVVENNQIEVYFDEAIDKSVSQNNFTVDNGMGAPTSWAFGNASKNSVLLTFANDFVSNTIYTVSITSIIKDCVGNSTNTGSSKFSIDEAAPYDVVINELMPDPEPVIELATAEYIELLNRTNKPISLSGWTLSSGSTTRDFPCHTIQPNEYIILCDDQDELTFSEYGKVVAFESFPSLSNEAGTVVIKNKKGDVINAVSYLLSWYANNNKDDGGWSLERIDPNNPCGQADNWRASNDEKGGTPGKINSINASNTDTKLPELWRASVIDDTKIRLYFTEALTKSSLVDLSLYTISNGIGNPVAISVLEPYNSAIILTLATPLQSGVVYTVTVNTSIIDCVGNPISSASTTARVAIPVAPSVGDVLINEIMYYPKEGGVDYIELYNHSEKIIDLKEIFVCDYDSTNEQLGTLKQIDSVGFLIFPQDYVVISTSQEKVKAQYTTTNPKGFLDVASLPTYSSTQGEVIITNRILEKIDEMRYYADMQFPLINDLHGVSLERIDFSRSGTDQTNWHSAAERVGFGTPAYINSQFMIANTDKSPFTLTPEVFTPDNDGDKDFILISYKLETQGNVANVTIFDAKGKQIKKIAQNEMLGTEGLFTWDGIDENNQKGNIGIYIIHIELFDIQGKVKKYKLPCVLGGKL